MGKGQGISRLRNGIERNITKSELERGYLFISKDRQINSSCRFTLNWKLLGIRKIDSYGRIALGRSCFEDLKEKKAKIRLSDGVIHVKLS